MNKALRDILAQADGSSLTGVHAALAAADRNDGIELSPTLRIRVLRNYSAEGLAPFVRWQFLRRGTGASVSFGEYDNVVQEALSMNRDDVDMVVVSLVLEEFAPGHEQKGLDVDDVFGRLQSICDTLASRTDAPVLINTFLPPVHPASGIGALGNADTLTRQVREINTRIIGLAEERAGLLVADFERILMRTGVDQGLDHRLKYLTRCPFRPKFFDAYAEEIAKTGQALAGKTKKVLILDCDNTLWGGVIGEDGIEGIRLDPHEYPGRAFYDFQRNVLRLQRLGVLVALCSKNNEEDVMTVLDSHPHCLLGKEHLVAHRINWQDKPSNIRDMARELNLGLDSLVFVDDSDMECLLVREALPEVEVIQVPGELSSLPDTIFTDGFFDKPNRSSEDAKRTCMYQQSAKRTAFEETFTDLDDYLSALELKAVMGQAGPGDIPRVAQLTQKTNQFNLTTRRYSEAEVSAMNDSPDHAVFTMAVSDRFGDSGLTGLCIARRNGDRAEIDTFLLSCRVLGRKLEQQFFTHCIEQLRQTWSPDKWEAVYLPTRKNSQVAQFWEQFGFTSSGTAEGKLYEAADESLVLKPVSFITVEAK